MPCDTQGGSGVPAPLWEVTRVKEESRDLSCPVPKELLPLGLALTPG